jgi:tripartite-type tricarboxylate transporter receptor subunit TctC
MSAHRILVSTAIGISVLSVLSAHAQDTYPNQPVKMIVPYPAGGGTDIVGRFLGEQMRKTLGQNVIVDNRPGASAMIGTAAVAKAAADGYNILVTAGEIAVNPHLYKDMQYDWEKDLIPLSLLVKVPNVLAVHTEVPAKNVQELIAYAKANPRKLTFSSSGIGNPQQLAGELLNKLAGIEVMHVPYKGAAPQIADVAGKHITMTFASIGAAKPFIDNGKLKAIAVTSGARVSMMPNVPALAEYPPLASYELVNFFGMFGPSKLPDAIIRKLNAAAVQGMKNPELAAKMKEMGFEPATNSPEQFAVYVRAESKKFQAIIAQANIKPE